MMAWKVSGGKLNAIMSASMNSASNYIHVADISFAVTVQSSESTRVWEIAPQPSSRTLAWAGRYFRSFWTYDALGDGMLEVRSRYREAILSYPSRTTAFLFIAASLLASVAMNQCRQPGSASEVASLQNTAQAVVRNKYLSLRACRPYLWYYSFHCLSKVVWLTRVTWSSFSTHFDLTDS